MKIKAVLFDLIGTTVIEREPDTVMRCFEKAFQDNRTPFDRELLRANRGKDKLEMIEVVLKKAGTPIAEAPGIFKSFEENFSSTIGNFQINTGVDEIMMYLREREIKVGLGSGLSRDIFDKVFDHLGWAQNDFDYVGIAGEVGKSRPDPAMIVDMMTKLEITSPGEFMKVGDTVADIEEGKNAGVLTVAVLSGTQPRKLIEDAAPDFMVDELSELKGLV